MVVIMASIAQKSSLASGRPRLLHRQISARAGMATLIREGDVERRHMLDSAELLLLISVVPALYFQRALRLFEAIILLIVFLFYLFSRSRQVQGGHKTDNQRQWHAAFVLFSWGFSPPYERAVHSLLGIRSWRLHRRLRGADRMTWFPSGPPCPSWPLTSRR